MISADYRHAIPLHWETNNTSVSDLSEKWKSLQINCNYSQGKNKTDSA